MKRFYKKGIKICVFVGMPIFLVLAGCSIPRIGTGRITKLMDKASSMAEEMISTSDKQESDSHWDKSIKKLVRALDQHDKELLRACFSEYVRKNDKNLDQEMDALFKAYPGETESWVWDGCSTQSFSSASDENREYVTRTAVLKSHGKNYYLYMEYTTMDLNNSGREGICCVDFTTPEVQAAFSDGRDDLITYKGNYNWKGQDRYKLHVTTEHKGEYQTRRIKGNEMIYTPTEIRYSSQDYLNFVLTDNSVKDFREKFGTENAGWENSQIMYYKVTDGDDLYVFIDYMDSSEGQVVYRIDLVNEEKKIKTIFRKE